MITGNPDPSDETITFAGELAAYFSKARYSNLVQVDVLEAKNFTNPLVPLLDLSLMIVKKRSASLLMRQSSNPEN